MTLAEKIARDELGEQKAFLAQMEAPNYEWPPWLNTDFAKKVEIAATKEVIASIEAKLADSQKLEEWWESVPLQTRQQWQNM